MTDLSEARRIAGDHGCVVVTHEFVDDLLRANKRLHTENDRIWSELRSISRRKFWKLWSRRLPSGRFS